MLHEHREQASTLHRADAEADPNDTHALAELDDPDTTAVSQLTRVVDGDTGEAPVAVGPWLPCVPGPAARPEQRRDPGHRTHATSRPTARIGG